MDLRDQKAKLIAERKETSKQEIKAYEEMKKGQESEEDKKARIQRGLESLNLASNTTSEQDQAAKRKNFYHEIRDAIRDS